MSRQRRHPAVERELGDSVWRAMKDLGWLVPETSAEVDRAEAELWESSRQRTPGTLPPFGLVLAPARPVKLVPLCGEAPDSVEETLARAARRGRTLSADVEGEMRRDRDHAEAYAAAHGAPGSPGDTVT